MDTHGHQIGDAVLVDVAYAVRRELRAFDLAYGLGDEEFLVLLPGAALDDAALLAERLRLAVARAKPAGLPVTMSLGVQRTGNRRPPQRAARRRRHRALPRQAHRTQPRRLSQASRRHRRQRHPAPRA